MLKLALLEVAEDVQFLWETVKRGQTVCVLPLSLFCFFYLLSNDASYLVGHECLAVLQMVPLHDGGAMKFSQRMGTPTK